MAWCDSHHFTLNVKKTEEIVFDPKALGDHSPLIIHDQPIAQIQSYKYLGVQIDSNFIWNTHVEWLCSHSHQRMYFLHRLRLYGVDQKIMLLFYQAVLESIIRYGMTAWYGNLSVKVKSKLIHLVPP